MTILQGILLYMLHTFNGDRSINGAFHLLQGKKSSQTLQDASLFKLSFLFGTLPTVDQPLIKKTADELLDLHLIEEKRLGGYFTLTSNGDQQLLDFLRAKPFSPYLDGLRFHNVTERFWLRFSLYVQCFSFLLAENKRFLPITQETDALQWVKKHFPTGHKERKQTAKALYEECLHLFEKLDEELAECLILRLSGQERIGYTSFQIAEQLNKDKREVELLFQASVHQMITEMEAYPTRYPVLFTMAQDLLTPVMLTESAKATFEWLKQGMGIETIATKRRLQKSTIEDHIVEIAIQIPSFSVEPFLTSEQYERIVRTAERVGTKRLRDIRAQLPKHIDYFKIRLALAKKEQ